MRIPPPFATGLVLFAALLAAGVHAQQMYRIVGPDGKVTYSDRAPANQQADALGPLGAARRGSQPTARQSIQVYS